MVKSRKAASKALPAIAHGCSLPHLQVKEVREGPLPAGPSVAEASPAGDRPPSRSPGYRSVRDELGKVTRLGRVLNYSDEQSSNNEEDDDIEPNSSASEARCLSNPPSSPDLVLNPALTIHPEVSVHGGSISPILATDLKATLANKASACDAALAFQRWRISSLKVLFARELNKVSMEAQQNESRLSAMEEEMEKKEKHLVHALADSAQLRAQLCTLETVNGQHHDSSDALQMDLAKALERAASSEAEVERYNKEIRKLRERLKSTEDEASRLDFELKATVSYFQKEKDGIAKENQVLLEQLARKDEEVLSQVQEINNLKSLLACLRVSRLELERLKSELQCNNVQATPEAMGSKVLQSQIKLEGPSLKASVGTEGQSVPSGPVLSQILDVLQKLTMCLYKNEPRLEPSEVKIPESEEKYMVRSDLPQKGAMHLEAAADCKPINSAGQVSSSLNAKTDTTRGLCSTCSSSFNLKGNKMLTVTCWKWRWFTAACEVQELSKEISSLKSVSKKKWACSQQSSFSSSLDSCQASLITGDLQNTGHPSVDLQAPLSSDKVLALLTSICKLSSQSAHREKEAFYKDRQFDHLLRVMARWMQRALRKRQLERIMAHWLRYLLQSWKDKFKCQNNVALTPAVHLRQGICHGSPAMSDTQIQSSTSNPKARNVDNLLIALKKGAQKPGKNEHTCKDQELETLQELLHHRIEALEVSIMKEISYWHQQHFGDTDFDREALGESSTNLVWKICCRMENCFFDARNEIMTYFGVLNKACSSSIYNMKNQLHVSAFLSKPMVRQTKVKIVSCKNPAERRSSADSIARKRKKIFL